MPLTDPAALRFRMSTLKAGVWLGLCWSEEVELDRDGLCAAKPLGDGRGVKIAGTYGGACGEEGVCGRGAEIAQSAGYEDGSAGHRFAAWGWSSAEPATGASARRKRKSAEAAQLATRQEPAADTGSTAA